VKKYQTDAERLEARRLSKQKYNRSLKGKATAKSYWASDAGRLVSRTFDRSKKRKVLKRKYEQSTSGKKRKAIWDKKYNLVANSVVKRSARRKLEHNRSVTKKYVKEHRDMYSAASVLVKLNRQKRVPKWIDTEDKWLMKEVYSLAEIRTKMFGFAWHVDHIIPLCGKIVSGLHVPINLRVIPAAENMAKYNKYNVINDLPWSSP